MENLIKEKDLILNYIIEKKNISDFFINYLKSNVWELIIIENGVMKFFADNWIQEEIFVKISSTEDFFDYRRYHKLKKLKCLKKEI